MRLFSTIERVVLRWRYPILLLWAVAWFIPAWQHWTHGTTDWNVIEYGARSIIRLNPHYPDGFHLYANQPEVQIGPPVLFLVAGFQWLPANAVALGFGIFMLLAGVAVVAGIERLAAGAGAESDSPAAALIRKRIVLLGGLGLLAPWAHSLARYRHLDDVFAIGFTILAMVLIQRGGRHAWWIAAVLLGVAVASKPWALGAAPVIGALPRERRAQAVLLFLASTGAWYAPFVLVDHNTLSQLYQYRLFIDPRSTLWALGNHSVVAPGWDRNAQIGLAVVMSLILLRRGRWLEIPLAAFAIRVVLDPQTWMYYGLGPIAGALLLDLIRRNRLPWWTLITVIAEAIIPANLGRSGGWVRLAWFVLVMAAVIAPRPTRATNPKSPASEPVGAPAVAV